MKPSKLFLYAAALVLLAGSFLGMMAQGKLDPTGSAIFLPPGPIQSTVSVNAIEVTDGTIGLDSQTQKETAFGYSFLGRTAGSFPGSFTLSMNCTPATPIASGTSHLTGGAWTLPVYLTSTFGGSKGYVGSLYGTLAKGTMDWDDGGTSAKVFFELSVAGGTQKWDGVGGYATFVGTLSVDKETQKTVLSGELAFTIK